MARCALISLAGAVSVAACACACACPVLAGQARELTPADLRQIEAVNQAWNRKGDQLGADKAFGSCNWYAVNKAIDLVKHGFAGSVDVAEVHTEHGDDHAVAEVKGTIHGKPVAIVLDNRLNWTARRGDLEAIGYSWTGVEFAQ